ncbi:MAG: AMP-binding protein [Pseudomonadota bacterium]
MSTASDQPLWIPSKERIAAANMTRFIQDCGQKDYAALYAWSIAEPVKFWQKVWTFCGVIGDQGAPPFLVDGDKMPGAHFFPQARLNLAENLLKRRDGGDAIVFWGEDKVKRRLSFQELYDQVSQCAQALKAVGVTEGDRVAGYLPNMPEAVIAMLATTSLGAIWSSASPDFGTKGVLGPIRPDRAQGAVRRRGLLLQRQGVRLSREGRRDPGRDADRQARGHHPLHPRHQGPHLAGQCRRLGRVPGAAPGRRDRVQPRAIQPPGLCDVLVGTTGAPKCIVHGVGGTVLQHLKELRLHSDVKDNDRVFYFTTCGWMMWNWVVSCLGCNATLLQFDGSPFHPSGNVLFDYADAEKMTLFGTSANGSTRCSRPGSSR